jgi:hypothetical protein
MSLVHNVIHQLDDGHRGPRLPKMGGFHVLALDVSARFRGATPQFRVVLIHKLLLRFANRKDAPSAEGRACESGPMERSGQPF